MASGSGQELEGGEVDGLGEVAGDVFPLGDELFVEGVELVGLGSRRSARSWVVFEPVPLDDGGFEQRGGGVGVVFEQLGGRPVAVVQQVEAAVDGGGLFVPGPLDEGDGVGGDFELGVALVVDDVLRGGEAHGLELVAGGFEGVDFGGGELVAGGLVPVGLRRGHRCGRVEGEALLLDVLLPVGAGCEGDGVALFSASAAVAAARRREGAAEAAAGGAGEEDAAAAEVQ